MQVTTIVGARPQFIKAAMVSRAFQTLGGLRETLVHTGQHYDDTMSKVFFDELCLPTPDVCLDIGSGSHAQQTGRMLEAIEPVLLASRPDVVVVYGDTNSTLAGALVAAKLNIPIAHVEAGLRSFNRRMPEEINRVVTDHMSRLLFAPTDVAVANLEREGIDHASVHRVGDVMFDAALHYADHAAPQLSGGAAASARVIDRGKPYVLATIHRAANTDDPARLEAIFSGLERVADRLRVIVPLHPRTRKALEGLPSWNRIDSQLEVIDPVGYCEMLRLERAACVIATDSGGIQKEAYFHRVPCVTLREETEWTELVAVGCNRLVPPVSAADVAEGIENAIAAGFSRDVPEAIYGDGNSANLIAQTIGAMGR